MKLWYSETAEIFGRLMPDRRLRWLLGIGLWTVVALLSSVHWRLFAPREDFSGWAGFTWVRMLVWYVWGLFFTPLILVLGNRFRVQWPHWRRSLFVLSGLSVVVTLAYMFIYAAIVLVNARTPGAVTYKGLLNLTLFQHLTYYYLAFWATIGLEQAVILFRGWHERELQASELRSQLTQSQLQMLQSQLQPHFLFNALNTISSVIIDGDRRVAHDLTAKLGELLRTSMERGERDLVLLSQEKHLLEQYIDLMKARFEDQLEVRVDFEPEALEALVPPFILQPLVENAIKHNVSQIEGRVHVIARAYLTDSTRLVLEVEDCTDEHRPVASQIVHAGRGHRLTEERLRCLFGDQYQFSAIIQGHGGMLVRLEFPFCRELVNHERKKL